MRRLVIVLTVFLSFASHAQHLEIGPEQRTALPDDVPAILGQWSPAIATDGRDFLVVWTDSRYSTLCAARITGEGEVLDRKPLRLPLGGIAYAAWTGSEYVVVGAGISTSLVHVGRDGTILGEARVLAPRHSLVAFSRSAIAVVAADSRELFVQTFDLRGRPLSAAVKTTLQAAAMAFALTSDGEDRFALVVTHTTGPEERGIHFASMTRSGVISPFERISESDPISGLQVAGTASRFTVTWWLDGLQQFRDVDRLGAVAGEWSMPFEHPPALGTGVAVGEDLLLPMWAVDGFVASSDLAILRHRGHAAPELVTFANGDFGEMELVLATNGTKLFLAWTDQWNVVYDVTGLDARRASPEARGHDIPRSASSQRLARGAMAGTTTLLVWQGERDPFQRSIAVGRIGENGELLDGLGVKLSDDAIYESEPQVVFDGRVFVVAWREENRIAGVRVTPAGAVLDPQPFTIETGRATGVTLASDGMGRTAVMYHVDSQLRLRIVANDGTVAPTVVLSAMTTRVIRGWTATFDGSAFLVAWSEYEPNPAYRPPCYWRCPPPYLSSDIRAARVNDRVLQSATLYATSGENDFYAVAKVIQTKHGAALAYDHARQIWFARVDAQLTVGSSRAIGDSLYSPDVAVIRGVPVISWFDIEAGIRVVTLNEDFSPAANGVFTPVALWDWTGTVVPGGSFGWVLYSRLAVDDDEYAGAPRTFARKVSFGPRRARALRR